VEIEYCEKKGVISNYSLELNGPLLPHVLPSLCHLMKSSQLEQYSASCAQLTSTIPFSIAKHGTGKMIHVLVHHIIIFYTYKVTKSTCSIVGQANFTKEEDCNAKIPSNVFGQENLSDCGFNQELLNHFCSPDPNRIEVLESFKFFNGLYTWSWSFTNQFSK